MASRTPDSVTMTVRIDRQALEVLEYHARLTGVKLRARLRDQLEAEAEDVSRMLKLDGAVPEPAVGRWIPRC
jgi:hypothetical protein